MPQEQTPETMVPDSDLKDGKVRPKSKVKVLFLNSKHHNVPYFMEEVHPSLAKKLIETGKAEKYKGKLTDEQKKANEEALLEKASARGRKGKTEAAAKDDLSSGTNEEFDDIVGDKIKGKGK